MDYDDTFDSLALNEPLREKAYGVPTAASISERVGILFAEGASTTDMASRLVSEGWAETPEIAHFAIKQMYRDWTAIADNVGLELADTKNWHIEMRHVLLKKTIDANPRAALAVLESLANLQGIKTTIDADLERIPISIELVARIDKPPSEEDKTNGE